MILVDTGPLVALFDPKDHNHSKCDLTFQRLKETLYTTVPVITEALHLLQSDSPGAGWLRGFIERQGLLIWFLNRSALSRAFELMEMYSDHPMDFADASLVTAAEALDIRKVFTIDRNDFETYRMRRGHRHYPFEVIF